MEYATEVEQLKNSCNISGTEQFRHIPDGEGAMHTFNATDNPMTANSGTTMDKNAMFESSGAREATPETLNIRA